MRGFSFGSCFSLSLGVVLLAVLGVALVSPGVVCGYPPAPHHTIYGVVRDQWGNPFSVREAEIIFTTENGVRVTGRVVPDLAPGVNYRIRIPMDAGITPDLYVRNAQRPLVPFRIHVKDGGMTYLPIQMQGGYERLGQPAGETRIDLTLGVDSEGDGIPDAWKDLVIAMLGGGLMRADIRPHDDLDGDGMTNLEEYIAGTYAWDPADNLWLRIVEFADEEAVLEFMFVEGRSYTVLGSVDLREWEKFRFRLPGEELERSSFFAFESGILRVHVPVSEGGRGIYFRLQVE